MNGSTASKRAEDLRTRIQCSTLCDNFGPLLVAWVVAFFRHIVSTVTRQKAGILNVLKSVYSTAKAQNVKQARDRGKYSEIVIILYII